MQTLSKKRHSKNCLSNGDWIDCEVCRTFNYGYHDAKADIANDRPGKWNYQGELVSISDQRKGFALKHYNQSYVKGYCKAYEC